MRLVSGNIDHCLHYRAFLNGVDVSNDCFYADDDLYEVGLYIRNAKGNWIFDPTTGGPAIELRRGDVQIVRVA